MITNEIIAIDENSFTAGIDGTVMLLLVGAKNAWIAHAFAVTLNARFSVVTMLTASPVAAGTNQYRNLNPVPGLAVKLTVWPIV